MITLTHGDQIAAGPSLSAQKQQRHNHIFSFEAGTPSL